jgi:hypothetical protein
MNTVIYLENGLNPQLRNVVEVDGSNTISELDPKWNTPYIAFLDGNAILRKDWGQELVEGNTLVFIDAKAIPQGGGDGGSNPLRIVLMIAVMYFTMGAGSGIWAAQMGMAGATAGSLTAMGTVVGSGLMMIGMALVNAVAPVPQPTSTSSAAAMAAPSPTYSLQAQANSARLESAIPEHFGKIQIFPDLASQPYVEYGIDNEQYLTELLCIGRGQYVLDNLKIENSLASSFDSVFTTLYNPNEIVNSIFAAVSNVPEVSGQELDATFIGPFIVNSSGSTVTEIGIDLVAPAGLYYANDDGSLSAKSIAIEVVATPISAIGVPSGADIVLTAGTTNYAPWGDWTTYVNPALRTSYLYTRYAGDTSFESWSYTQGIPANTALIEYMQNPVDYFDGALTASYRTRTTFSGLSFSAATNTPQRWTRRFPVAAGRYQVKVRRTDTKDTSTRAGHTVVWAAARGYHPASGNYGDVTLLAVTMRASNNLSMQASRRFNIIATRKLPIWTGSAWTVPTVTRNPVWAFVYQCKAVGLTDSQLDLPSLKTLADTLDARGDYFDGRFDNFVSFWEAISKTLSIVRAKPFMQGGILRVIRDAPQAIPVAMFSTRNIVKGSVSVDYIMPSQDTADNIDIKYFDETVWSPQTISTFIAGSAMATKAKVELFGVTNRNQAYREGTYQCAANRYRRKMIKFQTEMEGFIPSFGDLINIQHDMPGWGQAGEVISVSGNTLTLSESLTWVTGTHYLSLRRKDGSVSGPYVATVGTDNTKVVLTGTIDFTINTTLDSERTFYSFGANTTYTQPALVLSIKPISNTTVEITAINEDPAVHTADQTTSPVALVTSSLTNYTNAPEVASIVVTPVIFSSNLSISWSPAPWATSYIVQQSNDNGVTWFTIDNTTTTNSISSNKYFSTTLIRVAAISISRGPWKVSGAILSNATPAPIPVTAMATGTELAIHIQWIFNELRTDINYTEIWVSNSNDRTLATLLDKVSFPGQVYDYIRLASSTSGYFWIRSMDKYGSYSTFYPASATAGMYAVALGYIVDTTPPPTPTGVVITPGFTNISISTDVPTYIVGHGPGKTRIYGAEWTTGALPVFSGATKLGEFTGSNYTYAAKAGTTYYLWLKWVSIDGAESTTGSGGTNGTVAVTGMDIPKVLSSLNGAITGTQLDNTLSTTISLISAPLTTVGSVAYQVAAEAAIRTDKDILTSIYRVEDTQQNAYNLLKSIVTTDLNRVNAANEVALARSDLTTAIVSGISAEATQRTTLATRLDTAINTTIASVSSEATARSNADIAEATQRGILAAQLLGSDGTATTSGVIYNEATVRAAGDNALSQQITLLSAGAGEQFDWQSIWYFDTGVDGWAGNGTPTTAAGWLRAANQASGAYVESPASIATASAKYNQIRLRLRKTGTPTFAGWVYWQSTTDTTWDVARRIALVEPTYDTNNIGLCTVSPTWTGTINKIRVDLSSAQSVSNYFELDWVAVGRPSPGASSAQLLVEQTARIDADNIITISVSTLSSQVNNITNGLPATYALLATEQTTRANADTAETNARTTLAARVTNAEGSIVTNASAISTEASTRSTADSTNASSISTLSSQVNDASTGLPKTRSDIIAVQTTFSNSIESNVRDIRTLKSQSNQLDEAVLRAVLNGEDATVTYKGEIALASQELTTYINTGVSAEANARLSLAAIVNNATTDLATKASVTQVATAKAEAIAASASVTDTISARLNTGDYAAVQVQSVASATSVTGLLAQYTVKLDVNGKVSGYGLASTGPTGTGSTFEVRADKFSITAPTGAAAGYSPFTVLAVPTLIGDITLPAGVYAQNAFIQDGQITKAKIQDLAVTTAKIQDLAVTTAKIDNLTITGAKIALATIGTAQVGTLDASVITARTITTDRIRVGAATALQTAGSGLLKVYPLATDYYSVNTTSTVTTITSTGSPLWLFTDIYIYALAGNSTTPFFNILATVEVSKDGGAYTSTIVNSNVNMASVSIAPACTVAVRLYPHGLLTTLVAGSTYAFRVTSQVSIGATFGNNSEVWLTTTISVLENKV